MHAFFFWNRNIASSCVVCTSRLGVDVGVSPMLLYQQPTKQLRLLIILMHVRMFSSCSGHADKIANNAKEMVLVVKRKEGEMKSGEKRKMERRSKEV